MMGLTPGQAKVLAVIKRSFAERGIAPTMVEIARECGWASPSCAWGVVQNLVGRGYIRRRRGQAIELIEQPPRYRFIPVEAITWPVAA